MNRKVTDVLVGLFVVLGFGALLFLALQAGNLASFSLAKSYAVSARFDNIGGLKVRAPIKSAGVTVGRIAQISFDDQTFRASVVLEIEEQYKFPKDSSVKILTSGLLGEQYVGLEPGGDLKNLADGDKLTLTQSAVVLENLIGQFLYGRQDDGGGGK
ncbi:MAG: outer membrane lipid asymmetry maintenance protein MlaD [Burkholderiaceae bacterium]